MKEGKKSILDGASVKTELKGYLFMIIGCVVFALGTSMFLAPSSIIAGGVTGLSVMINYLDERFPIGVMSIVLNVPILLLGYKYNGTRFILRSLVTIVILGIFTDLLAFVEPITADPILSSLYGGILQGVAIGLFVRYQFSGGGTEILGRVLARFIKGISITVGIGIIDAVIVIVGAVITGPSNMLYAFIVIFLTTKVSEVVLVGLEKSKLCIIITDKGEEVSKALMERSPRGITGLEGRGMYTHASHDVLLTCVKNNQLTDLKRTVNAVDDKAFIIINESAEVRGLGFKALGEEDN